MLILCLCFRRSKTSKDADRKVVSLMWYVVTTSDLPSLFMFTNKRKIEAIMTSLKVLFSAYYSKHHSHAAPKDKRKTDGNACIEHAT